MHRDERGTISIVTVFAIFVFTILLTMIRNVARHADDKLRMQNAADAAAYTGGVTIARGMNAIAFTNHLEAEIFALVAYMREGRDRNAEALVPPILDMWEEIGGVFERHGSAADYDKFHRLGAAIQQKVPLERRLVSAFGEMTYRHSELTLPVLEYILAGEFIPQFQRAVVRMTPQMAHLASAEIAARYGDDERISRQHGGLAPAAR
ncbi:MAG: hypothetical protein KY476_07480, partial [Planctomycetes bacterium]|nr:hypothetical protein [Planctomycetota bacterium]